MTKIMEIPITNGTTNGASVIMVGSSVESPTKFSSSNSIEASGNNLPTYYLKLQLLKYNNRIRLKKIILFKFFSSSSSFLVNQNLERTLHELESKQIIEFGKARIKSEILKMQESHIRNLEKILEKARISHQQLRNRVEVVEFEAIRFREKMLDCDVMLSGEGHLSKRSRITRTFSKKKNTKNQHEKSTDYLLGEVVFKKTFDENYNRPMEELIRRMQKRMHKLFYFLAFSI